MFYEYNINCKDSIYKFKQHIYEIIKGTISQDRVVIFYFIGTDRCTGDCLGPIAGERFKLTKLSNILFFGTLENPVHAVNISSIVSKNNLLYKNALTIAVDASLGSKSNVGKVFFQDKPVKPGSALDKSLPDIGDYSITGIVNYSDDLDFLILQNTRLYNVFKLSDFIAEGIYLSLLEYNQNKKAL